MLTLVRCLAFFSNKRLVNLFAIIYYLLATLLYSCASAKQVLTQEKRASYNCCILKVQYSYQLLCLLGYKGCSSNKDQVQLQRAARKNKLQVRHYVLEHLQVCYILRTNIIHNIDIIYVLELDCCVAGKHKYCCTSSNCLQPRRCKIINISKGCTC